MSHQKRCYAFTLIEVLIAIVMITILIALIVPSYSTHLRRARYLSVVTATEPFKIGVEECFALLGDLSDCISGHNGVPLAVTHSEGHGIVHTVKVGANGVITATPYAGGGIIDSDIYVLTPVIVDDELNWQPSGSAVLKGYAH